MKTSERAFFLVLALVGELNHLLIGLTTAPTLTGFPLLSKAACHGDDRLVAHNAYGQFIAGY